jgi:hypothetical protein
MTLQQDLVKQLIIDEEAQIESYLDLNDYVNLEALDF